MADLIDADFSLHILEALLDDGDEGSRRHQGSIDVGLTDVALYAKGEGRVREAWRKRESLARQTYFDCWGVFFILETKQNVDIPDSCRYL